MIPFSVLNMGKRLFVGAAFFYMKVFQLESSGKTN